MKCVSEYVRAAAYSFAKTDFEEKFRQKQAFYSQLARIPSPFPIKKLTIELDGNSRALSSHCRIFADGKQLPCIKRLRVEAHSDEPYVDVDLIQSATEIINGEGKCVNNPINIKWCKDYDSLPNSVEVL